MAAALVARDRLQFRRCRNNDTSAFGLLIDRFAILGVFGQPFVASRYRDHGPLAGWVPHLVRDRHRLNGAYPQTYGVFDRHGDSKSRL